MKTESKKTQETKSVEETVNKISVLHLAKLQASNAEMEKVDKQAIDIHYRRAELKQLQALLDVSTEKTLKERNDLFNEIYAAYGTLNIDSETGEIKNME
ncbi:MULTISPECIES: hypothetical protein [unclassified Myroides]|uniref:hypothetical protein n=1 Tax=unclassified Myroides TaxID=2642485 RepID=UPI003D2F6931